MSLVSLENFTWTTSFVPLENFTWTTSFVSLENFPWTTFLVSLENFTCSRRGSNDAEIATAVSCHLALLPLLMISLDKLARLTVIWIQE